MERKVEALEKNPGKARATREREKGGRKGKSTQKCFSWNHGNAPCGDLPPGQKYTAKVQRLHRCTKCDSPGHPSRTCPKKAEAGEVSDFYTYTYEMW